MPGEEADVSQHELSSNAKKGKQTTRNHADPIEQKI